MENSSDSSLGRRPESKSDEFSVTTPLVVEITSFLVEIARRLSYHLLGFEVECDDGIRSPRPGTCIIDPKYTY